MGFLSRKKRESQREVFEREALPHLDALHGLALRLTRDERQAEDLVQDALVKAYRFFHRFEEGSNIKAWLFKVLVNTFYNTIRKEKNIGKLHAGVELEPHRERYLGEATVAGRHAEEAVLDALAVEEIKREVEALPEEFRTAVLLCDVHDLSYKEIAEIVGCPVGTVMSRLHRGRKLLQKRLHGYAVEQGYLPAEPEAEEPAAAIASLQDFRRRKAVVPAASGRRGAKGEP
jgi:RNA polymerase sigma-70 factor (ECF subfamily)